MKTARTKNLSQVSTDKCQATSNKFQVSSFKSQVSSVPNTLLCRYLPERCQAGEAGEFLQVSNTPALQYPSHQSQVSDLKLILSLCLSLGVVSAQVASDYLYKGARSAALAGSAVAHWEDSWAIFNNPAGLSQIPSLSGAASYHKVFNLSYLPYTIAGVARPVPPIHGVVGFGVERLSVSYLGRELSSETAASLSHGFFLQKDIYSSLAFGYTLKYFQIDYGDSSAGPSGDGSDGIALGRGSGFGIDIGLQASLRERHWIGVFVSNINRPKIGRGGATTSLPQRLQVGMAYSPYSYVWTLFSITKASNRGTQYHVGLEYFLFQFIQLRFGTHTNPNRFGAGFSLTVKWVTIDYGLITHPVLSLTHQISVGVTL